MQQVAPFASASSGLAFHAADAPAAEMAAYLQRQRPHSAAEALRLLRLAYPKAALGQRVTACELASR